MSRGETARRGTREVVGHVGGSRFGLYSSAIGILRWGESCFFFVFVFKNSSGFWGERRVWDRVEVEAQ